MLVMLIIVLVTDYLIPLKWVNYFNAQSVKRNSLNKTLKIWSSFHRLVFVVVVMMKPKRTKQFVSEK
jgi:hypothetical protein